MGLDMNMIVFTKENNPQEKYFRKANHIHNFIVKNIKTNYENCDEIEIHKDTFLKLKSICENVVKSVSETDIKFLEVIYEFYHLFENCRFILKKDLNKRLKEILADNAEILKDPFFKDIVENTLLLIKARSDNNRNIFRSNIKKIVYENDIQKRLQEILPTQQGFFFGSNVYCEYLIKQCSEFVEYANGINENDITQILYQADW